MTSLKRLRALAKRIAAEAENQSPMEGHSKGQAGVAPIMRQWARTIEDIASQVETGN